MTIYNENISNYITGLYALEDEALHTARNESPKKGLPAINIQPEEGRFLQLLVRASGGRRALEIGTLGGYSGIWIARGLAPGGKLITLEKSAKHAAVASEHFALAGVADRVEIRLGDAPQLLVKLKSEGPFDFVFIDAEKTDYRFYFDWALENIRVGGVIAAHNAFRNGEAAEAGEAASPETAAIRALNQYVAAEPRAVSTIFPAGDGTLIAVKVA
jgi:caffeoyl-CoA O-methyltransferase